MILLVPECSFLIKLFLKGCAKGVKSWWSDIAKVIYSPEAADILCDAISDGKCHGFEYRYKIS